MLIVDRDPDTGETHYMVCNDQGLCLIRTTSSAIAAFVNAHSGNIDPNLRLNIGGDPGTRKERYIWHYIRRR